MAELYTDYGLNKANTLLLYRIPGGGRAAADADVDGACQDTGCASPPAGARTSYKRRTKFQPPGTQVYLVGKTLRCLHEARLYWPHMADDPRGGTWLEVEDVAASKVTKAGSVKFLVRYRGLLAAFDEWKSSSTCQNRR